MALQRRFLTQPPTSGLVAHFDHGGQCLENAYRSLLHQHEAVHSQSLWVECYDNAQAERLWSRLKTELLKLHDWPVFADLADTQASVADYFDYKYYERFHSSAGNINSYYLHQQQLAYII